MRTLATLALDAISPETPQSEKEALVAAVPPWQCSCPWGQYGGALCSHTRAVEVWLDHETMALSGASQAAYVGREEAA